jgi:hypothetical protein
MSPVVGSENIVYEVALTSPSCVYTSPSCVFTTEDLQLDTREAGNDGAAGPVTTNQPLDDQRWFLVTVQGTTSLTDALTWAMPPNVICGIPEQAPQVASPGVTNHWVGTDAEINFAAALPAGSDCSSMEMLGYPPHHTRFQVDLGSGFKSLEPMGGIATDPAPSHRYRFLIEGEGNLASFRWEDAQTSDNYGVFSIRVEEVNPTDVGPAVDYSPRPAKVLMLSSVPDPFNPTTEIRYYLPQDMNIALYVYDIRGRVIRRLFSGMQSAGYGSAVWDGLYDDGMRAPSGIYFARVTTPVGSATERMTLVK